MSAEESKVHHIYDGIEEQDNHLPNWWLGILFGTMVFSAGYWVVYQIGNFAPDPGEEYKVEAEALAAIKAAQQPKDDDSLEAEVKKPELVEEGKQVFATTCASCHGAEGQGLVGPNLTDEYWIHGAAPKDIQQAVVAGFVEKGMPPWGDVLGPARVKAAVAYVVSLKGKNVQGKEPQGEKVE